LKAVLDTNVLVSALFWRGIPYRCLLAAEADLYELVISDEIVDELAKVLVEKLRLTKGEAEESVGGNSKDRAADRNFQKSANCER
jgi:predicted nucleic acid-binding protein